MDPLTRETADARHDAARLVDEILARYRAEGREAVERELSAPEDCREELRDVLPAIRFLEEAADHDSSPRTRRPGLPVDSLVSRRLGEYRLLREVGRGGMGIVYEAIQESLGRHVAVKVLPFHSKLGEACLQRFRREALAAARLHHRNVVPVFGIGEELGLHYFAMQFIEGESLQTLLGGLRACRDGNVASAEACVPALGAYGRISPSPAEWRARHFRFVAELGIQAAEALDYAHRQGVLHRDIKPSNLLLGLDGTVWVTDFGLAKVEGCGDLTSTREFVGTLSYMAPERFKGQSTAHGDIYSLGVTLCEALLLRRVFAEPDPASLFLRVSERGMPSLRQIDRAIPRDLERILLKAAARDPAERYASGGELAQDLRRYLDGVPPRARKASSLVRAWRWSRRRPSIALLLALVVLLTGALLAGCLAWHAHMRSHLQEAEHAHLRSPIIGDPPAQAREAPPTYQ